MASKQLQETKNMRLQIDLKFNLVRWKKKSICLFEFIEQTNRFVVAMLLQLRSSTHTQTATCEFAEAFFFVFSVRFK